MKKFIKFDFVAGYPVVKSRWAKKKPEGFFQVPENFNQLDDNDLIKVKHQMPAFWAIRRFNAATS